ncbi:MAG: phes: phenylalanine--trna ligase alpha subunit [Verrucomicrobiales bacterium]|nr:phes: phenylalanine--trna ligase alpha subunit [Verrucomicrobiales bacterium]
MESTLSELLATATAEIPAAADETALEELRVKFLGKKGSLTALSGGMRDVPPDRKAAVGAALNEARNGITAALETRKAALIAARDAKEAEGIDLTLPGRPPAPGALHPLTQVLDRAVGILRRMGFALAAGPEVETEWHCFDALNTPADHPARHESDTFYFNSGLLLRTHTSSVQVRAMQTQTPPLRIIAPGSAFRRDEIDATHLSAFNQLEGLYVAENVSLGQLKGTLESFFRALFGPATEVRFRPHFFPFTEPSYEVDVKLSPKGQAPRWVEILGCGMVDPAVFEAICEARGDDVYHPDKVTGFAFGMGLERLAMIQWGIPDIRHLIENDTRFLGQFA